ncbi:4-coumarate--CoA ligase-like 4 [Apostasia shenzhenica]|uniref:4-coumarate--CoA ligase n=1 Tax=Apostasia shenzhenica TaxID=1088818 RepID=A0A2I0AX44_9ASPA|nr:4-coumarate--CoA ligase-like 4 [Apostasia shenzhenica]
MVHGPPSRSHDVLLCSRRPIIHGPWVTLCVLCVLCVLARAKNWESSLSRMSPSSSPTDLVAQFLLRISHSSSSFLPSRARKPSAMASQAAAPIDQRSGFCAANSIFYSKRNPVPLPSEPYLDVNTFISSRRHSGTVALIDATSGRRISFPELWKSIASVASALSSAYGVRKGHVVLLLSPNSIYFPIVSLAVMSLGAILTTTNPLNTPDEISKQIADSRPVIGFTTRLLLPKLIIKDFPIVLLEESRIDADPPIISTIKEMISIAPGFRQTKDRISQDDTATLLYSSGTTGTSKGVVSTHRNLISMVQIILNRFKLEGDGKPETFICTVPMFHVYGLAAFATGLLGSGSTIVILSKFELGEMIRAIRVYNATYLPLVPPILVAMLGVEKPLPLGSLRRILSGGAPLSREVIEGFREKYPAVEILQGYGLTETTGIGASTDSATESLRYGTAGLISPNTEARIVDPETGKSLPVNQTGELWIRGPFVMRGYFKNEEATRTTMDGERWLRTGDLCYIDDDGFLFVVDRLKELIKYKGYQVAPAELEALLLTHPEITDAAVIPFPDEEVGQYPMAYVVRKGGSELTESSVMKFVGKQVAPYKKVRRVAFVPSIPKNPSGKILRKDLIKLAISKSKL